MPDTLVQSPGRVQLCEQMDRAIAVCRDNNSRFALLLFNLHTFREINIQFGHALGDAVLARVAELIAGVLRPRDRLFHLGSDEFAVIVTDVKAPQVAEFAMTKILSAINASHEIAGNTVPVSAVAGAALFPDHAGGRDELLRAADAALHHAGGEHTDHCMFDASLRLKEQRFTDLRNKLRDALDNADLMLYYQPQIDLQQGTLSGCEALARWNHPHDGWIKPDQFIPVAEKSELIDILTYWSINVALREWSEFSDAGPSGSIAINLSAKLLQSREVVELVNRAINIWGAEPASLVLEVTESAMMSDPETAMQTLRALHDMGITLSIDDFGTGYSSLAYLKKLPVAELKIDKSFVQHMAENQQDRKIVQSIIDLAHNLEMSVVAEGIENQQALDMLIGMGCDFGQGYYLGRPMPMADMPPWLEGGNWRRSAPIDTQRDRKKQPLKRR
jgi:diguanylate cyclase (GGDEF)-like protein